MRTLIVSESLFGTNRTIAEAIAAGMGDAPTTTLIEAETAPVTIDEQVDLLLVGGTNHQFGLPRPTTRAEAAKEGKGAPTPAERGLREWLDGLRLTRPGQRVAVWDTRVARAPSSTASRTVSARGAPGSPASHLTRRSRHDSRASRPGRLN